MYSFLFFSDRKKWFPEQYVFKTLTNERGYTGQITKTDCKGNIDHWSEDCNSKIPAKSQMTIYPNPSSDKITIEATFDFDEIQVFDTYRQRTIYKNPCSCPRMELDVSKLAAGVYGVIISGDENVASSKLVKI